MRHTKNAELQIRWGALAETLISVQLLDKDIMIP